MVAWRGHAGAQEHPGVGLVAGGPLTRYRLADTAASCAPARATVVQRVGELTVDRASPEVMLRGQRLELSRKVFALLGVLCEQPSRRAFRSPRQTRRVDSHACRLRRKLEQFAGDRFIVNVWGVGYRLVDPIGAEQAQAA